MDTLLDRLRKNNPDDNARANRHAVAFLAHKEEIIAALNDGWSARKIWEQMTKDKTVSMCYVSFCRHVNKTIRPRAGGKGHTVGITPVAPKPRKKSSEAQAEPNTESAGCPIRAGTSGATEGRSLRRRQVEKACRPADHPPENPGRRTPGTVRGLKIVVPQWYRSGALVVPEWPEPLWRFPII